MDLPERDLRCSFSDFLQPAPVPGLDSGFAPDLRHFFMSLEDGLDESSDMLILRGEFGDIVDGAIAG